MLENQVEELEIINEDYEEKQLQWNIARYYCNFFSRVLKIHLLLSLCRTCTTYRSTLNGATECHPFGKIFLKPEVFPNGVSQTESRKSAPKVVELDSSYDGILRR